MTERTHARIPHLSEMGKVAPGPGHLRPEMRQDRGPPRGACDFYYAAGTSFVGICFFSGSH